MGQWNRRFEWNRFCRRRGSIDIVDAIDAIDSIDVNRIVNHSIYDRHGTRGTIMVIFWVGRGSQFFEVGAFGILRLVRLEWIFLVYGKSGEKSLRFYSSVGRLRVTVNHEVAGSIPAGTVIFF